jgi:hypothetical protein
LETDNNDELQDTPAAAKFLHLHPGTLCNRRVRGEPPTFIRLGKAIRYRKRDLLDFIEQGRVEPVK